MYMYTYIEYLYICEICTEHFSSAQMRAVLQSGQLCADLRISCAGLRRSAQTSENLPPITVSYHPAVTPILMVCTDIHNIDEYCQIWTKY